MELFDEMEVEVIAEALEATARAAYEAARRGAGPDAAIPVVELGEPPSAVWRAAARVVLRRAG